MKWIFSLVLIFNVAYAECNFSFTPEQNSLLHLSYAVGDQHDLGYTMAALTWKEGFVGRYVVRINPKDGKNGSYGVTHVLLDTAMWMLDIDSTWEAKSTLIPKLMNDDLYTLHLSMQYLMKFSHLPWKKQVEKYNGSGPRAEAYAQDVTERVRLLMKCKYFSSSLDNKRFVN